MRASGSCFSKRWLRGYPSSARRSPGYLTVLKDRWNALVVPPRDPLSAARAIVEIMDDPALGPRCARTVFASSSSTGGIGSPGVWNRSTRTTAAQGRRYLPPPSQRWQAPSRYRKRSSLPRTTTLKIAFAAFTVAQLVSIFGDRLHQFSVVGMIGRVAPGSAAELFQFALFSHLPILIFAPFLGSLVDRTNRVVVLVVVDAIRGMIVVFIPTLYHSMGSLYAFYIPVFFLSLANLLFAPAKSAVIAEFFEPLKLLRINAILWGLGIVGTIGGFVAGGWLFDYRSWETSFYSDAASYLVSVLFLLPLFLIPRGRKGLPSAQGVEETSPPTPTEQPTRRRSGILGLTASFREGVEVIRADRRIAYGLIAQTSLLGVFGIVYAAGIMFLVSQGSQTTSLLFGWSFCFGGGGGGGGRHTH